MLQAQTTIFSTFSIFIASAAMLFFVIFFYLLIYQLQRRKSLHQKEMFELKASFERTIMQSQLEIQEQTFRTISQEIHDNIGQVLSLAKLNLNTIPQQEVSDKIALTEELLGKAITDLRDISKSLHPEKIADIGLVNAIRNEMLLVQKTAKIKTEFTTNADEINPGNEKAVIIFRMIQEALHNIIRHAKAKRITLAMQHTGEKIIIEITDDGVGFNTEKLKATETGIGLKSIRQRCALINAQCILTSQPGTGTTVTLDINL